MVLSFCLLAYHVNALTNEVTKPAYRSVYAGTSGFFFSL